MSQIRRGGRTGGRPSPRHFLILLSSPGDVAEERRLSRKLIKERLPVDPFLHDRATFDAVSWDDPDAGTPMLGTMTPQECVDRFGAKPPHPAPLPPARGRGRDPRQREGEGTDNIPPGRKLL